MKKCRKKGTCDSKSLESVFLSLFNEKSVLKNTTKSKDRMERHLYEVISYLKQGSICRAQNMKTAPDEQRIKSAKCKNEIVTFIVVG